MNGTPSCSDSAWANVVFPEPEMPATETRRIDLAMDRRERRRPRAQWRDLATGAVQRAIAERVLRLHQLVDLRRPLIDDRRACVPEEALDPGLRRVPVRA